MQFDFSWLEGAIPIAPLLGGGSLLFIAVAVVKKWFTK